MCALEQCLRKGCGHSRSPAPTHPPQVRPSNQQLLTYCYLPQGFWTTLLFTHSFSFGLPNSFSDFMTPRHIALGFSFSYSFLCHRLSSGSVFSFLFFYLILYISCTLPVSQTRHMTKAVHPPPPGRGHKGTSTEGGASVLVVWGSLSCSASTR